MAQRVAQAGPVLWLEELVWGQGAAGAPLTTPRFQMVAEVPSHVLFPWLGCSHNVLFSLYPLMGVGWGGGTQDVTTENIKEGSQASP